MFLVGFYEFYYLFYFDENFVVLFGDVGLEVEFEIIVFLFKVVLF